MTFDSKSGSDVQTQTIAEGSTAQKPTDPTKDDYFFKGWYKEEALTTLFDFTTETITSNLTLYAKWKKVDISFSLRAVASSLEFTVKTSLVITNLTNMGAVIRLATEVAPTPTQAQTSKGYVNLSVESNSTRKFSISQHYDTDFTNGGFTLADVLTPNTKYILYLYPSTIDLNQISIKGGEVMGDRVQVLFTTASLPAAGDAVWSKTLESTVDVINLKEYHFMQTQTGIIVAFFQITKPFSFHAASWRISESSADYENMGTYAPSNGAPTPNSNYYYNYGTITGYISDYGYFIVSEKQPLMKITLRSTHTYNDGSDTSLYIPISRY